MSSLRMARKNERHKSAKKFNKKKMVEEKEDSLKRPTTDHSSPPALSPKWEKPKKMSKRQAKRLEQELAQEAAANQDEGINKKKSKSKKFHGPTSPQLGKKLGTSGNIAYGGHGKEWKNTPFAKRISNNHMLRIKREQAARLKQLEAMESPGSLLSGKAKKTLIKVKRAKKREKLKEREEQERIEAEEAAKIATTVAIENNKSFKKHMEHQRMEQSCNFGEEKQFDDATSTDAPTTVLLQKE